VIELTTGDAVILSGEDNEAFKHFVEKSNGIFRNLTAIYENDKKLRAA
jgi:alkylated DNA repair dioxygenase AlkB